MRNGKDDSYTAVSVFWLPGTQPVMLPVDEIQSIAVLSVAFHNTLSKMGISALIPDCRELCAWLASEVINAMSITTTEQNHDLEF
jgi:hypothetical protein